MREDCKQAAAPCGHSAPRPVALDVQITDPSFIEELADSLRRSGFRVMRTGSSTLAVKESEPLPNGPGKIEGAAELELDLYLQVWEVIHPGVRALRIQ